MINQNSSISLLQKVPLFAGLKEEALRNLTERCRRRTFKAQEALIHEGDPGHTLYVLISGHVNIQTISNAGEIIHLAMRGPGEHFGEMALLDGKPRMADVITAEACDMLMLDRAEFLQCIKDCPQIALNIMMILSNRLREAGTQVQKHQELDVTGRVAKTLLDLMQTHGVEEAGNGKRLLARISQQELADRIGATRESVNRSLSILKDTKCLRMDRRQIIVLNERKLQQKCFL